VSSGPVILQNSTISGNRSDSIGGGIFHYLSNPLTIQNSTIAFNEAASEGGGIVAYGANVNLESTIVANNRAPNGPDLFRALAGDKFFATYSLIGSTAGTGADFTGDATTNALIGQDPLLAPLAFNGGPTQTHKLKKGSPAINAGSNSSLLTTDQRGPGFKRKLGIEVDIGAFERQ
jgi:hypothetical protein